MHASICDLLADLVQNAIEADAHSIDLELREGSNHIEAKVSDNGKGMDQLTLSRARDPFFSEPGKHKRRVGLGIPFLYQIAEQTGGEAEIKSTPGKGSCVKFCFDSTHTDLPPLGDVATTLLQLMSFDRDFDFQVKRSRNGYAYQVSRSELIDALGELKSSDSLLLARTYLRNQEMTLNEDVNNG